MTQSARVLRPQITALILIALYVAVWTYLVRDLTFYWDDYFILDSQFNDSLPDLLASGVNGNWWPLSTIVTYVEVRIFGTWYVGYLLVNAALNAVNGYLLWLLATSFAPSMKRHVVLLPILIYPLTLQVTVNATVLTTSWPLSVTWALLAALTVARSRHWGLTSVFLLLSWLSMSGMFGINATLVTVTALATWYRAGELTRGRALGAALIPISGIGGTLIGYQVMRSAPSNDLAPPEIGASSLLSIDFVSLLKSILALSGSWIASPVIPFAYVYERILTTAAIFLAEHLVLLAVVAGVVLAISLTTYMKFREGRRLPWPVFVQVIVLSVPVALLSGVLAFARGGNMFAPRYGIMWLIPVAIIWVLAASLFSESSAFRRRISAGIGTGILAFAIVMFPTTALQAINVDRPRTDQSDEQAALINQCVAGESVRPLESMAPGLDPEKFCPIMRQLDAAWWFR